jgi:hypothetical protein
MACNLTTNGTCAPTAAGAGPGCPAGAASACATLGCDGGGNCQVYSSSTVCAPGTCASNGSSFTETSHCDGTGDGLCVPGPMDMCDAAMICDPTMGGCQP